MSEDRIAKLKAEAQALLDLEAEVLKNGFGAVPIRNPFMKGEMERAKKGTIAPLNEGSTDNPVNHRLGVPKE